MRLITFSLLKRIYLLPIHLTKGEMDGGSAAHISSHFFPSFIPDCHFYRYLFWSTDIFSYLACACSGVPSLPRDYYYNFYNQIGIIFFSSLSLQLSSLPHQDSFLFFRPGSEKLEKMERGGYMQKDRAQMEKDLTWKVRFYRLVYLSKL